jgi:hypothetical protein
MKPVGFFFSILIIFLSACGSSWQLPAVTQVPTNSPNRRIPGTTVPEFTLESETLQAVPSFTSFSGPCATPLPDQVKDFINSSITIKDNGRTFVTHVTSRFWIYLDDRIYPLRDLLNAIPVGLIGYVSNGSIRGPQCYPIMFEAVREGKGRLQVKDFQLSIIIDNNLPASPLPLH